MCDRIILFIPNNRILYAPLLENVNYWNHHFRYCRNLRMVQRRRNSSLSILFYIAWWKHDYRDHNNSYTIDDYIWAIEMDDENRHESVYYSNSCIHHHGIARIHILKTWWRNKKVFNLIKNFFLFFLKLNSYFLFFSFYL